MKKDEIHNLEILENEATDKGQLAAFNSACARVKGLGLNPGTQGYNKMVDWLMTQYRAGMIQFGDATSSHFFWLRPVANFKDMDKIK